MFCARLFICALWSPAGKGLTSWLSFVVSSVSLSLSHWYPGSGVVLDCIDSWSLHHYLLSPLVTTGDHDFVVTTVTTILWSWLSNTLRTSSNLDKYSTKIKYRVDMKFNVKSHYLQLWPWHWVCMIKLCVLHTLAVSWTSYQSVIMIILHTRNWRLNSITCNCNPDVESV